MPDYADVNPYDYAAPMYWFPDNAGTMGLDVYIGLCAVLGLCLLAIGLSIRVPKQE